jgi:uncharacterized damage-inducible protein DinB
VALLPAVRALYAYNEWANGHVLDAAAGLNAEDYGRELGASFGSVRGNLEHVLSAQTVWLARWSGEGAAAMPAGDHSAGLAALREAYRHSHERLRAFVGSLNEDALSRVVTYVDTRGEAQERALWQSMLHVVNHGTHHRAETALLLTALRNPPRQLDYMFFEIERAGGAPRLR